MAQGVDGTRTRWDGLVAQGLVFDCWLVAGMAWIAYFELEW